MSETSEVPFPSGGQSRETKHTERPAGGHDSHRGRPRSWVLVGVVIAAFCAGGVAVVDHLWPLFWACLGVVVLAIPVGKIIGIMDDTVVVAPPPGRPPPDPSPGSAADPGVRIGPDQGISSS